MANTVICAGIVGANLFVAFGLVAGNLVLGHLGLLYFHVAAITVAAIATKDLAWRRVFLIVAVITATTGIVVHANLSTLTVVQKFELGSLVLGSLALIAGHIGWMRQDSERDDLVSFNLSIGSLLLAIPLVYGIISDRLYPDEIITAWRYVHEAGGIVIGLLLLGSGMLCRIRSTTIVGSILTFVLVFSNILLINLPDQLQTTSALMMIGGGLFFGTALLLSIYRERLLKLPAKMKDREGVFQVLEWR